MATSHGDGGGAAGAGGALVAMSAAIAELAKPATKAKDKATLFITCPFYCPCLYSGDPNVSGRYEANPCSATRPTNLRSVNLREFFNFVNEQPSLKQRQMLTFYAFSG
jgi:hypothetical protein